MARASIRPRSSTWLQVEGQWMHDFGDFGRECVTNGCSGMQSSPSAQGGMAHTLGSLRSAQLPACCNAHLSDLPDERRHAMVAQAAGMDAAAVGSVGGGQALVPAMHELYHMGMPGLLAQAGRVSALPH